VDLLLVEYREVYIHARKVVIERLGEAIFQKTKGPTIAAPEGSIGRESLQRNYAKHLIDQYNDFASKQPNRPRFSFAAIYGVLKKRYGVGKWELIPLTRFDDLCGFLQQRIDGTFIGKVNRSKGYPNYSTLAEYRRKYFAT
jgi:hypothetical protein